MLKYYQYWTLDWLCISWCFGIKMGSVKVTSVLDLKVEAFINIWGFWSMVISIKLYVSPKCPYFILFLYIKSYLFHRFIHINLQTLPPVILYLAGCKCLICRHRLHRWTKESIPEFNKPVRIEQRTCVKARM